MYQKKPDIILKDLFIFTFFINKVSHTLTHSCNSGITTGHYFLKFKFTEIDRCD